MWLPAETEIERKTKDEIPEHQNFKALIFSTKRGENQQRG